MVTSSMKNLSAYCLAVTAVGIFCLLFKTPPKSRLFSAVSPKVKLEREFQLHPRHFTVSFAVSSPNCWSMFNVGAQRLSSGKKMPSRKLEYGLAPGTSYYEELSGTLPSVLRILPNGTSDLLRTSRLQVAFEAKGNPQQVFPSVSILM
ncbi:uncharacterized protein LOC135226754 [Macrobrachium nipponense]|uniref:uncharacterized protein LOC135226754 n=1 Tax=Macrobrachium nipponense TaxID=159736 RepID=UPI0030C81265